MAHRSIRSSVAMSLAVSITASTASADVIYVDANATGPAHDGSSWCQAFLTLSDALDVATSGSTLRLADGVYVPDVAGLENPREAYFALQGVNVVGGFAGCGAADPDERAPRTYESILSGDLAGDDPGGSMDDNTYHVVIVSGPTLSSLDGITLRGGNADDREGGGIYSLGGSFRLDDCILQDNVGWRGAAIYLEAGSAELAHCHVRHNSATGEGGAIFAATSGLSLDNCSVFENTAGSDGGALFVDLCTVPVTNTTFVANTSDFRGGAIYAYVGTFLDVDNSILWSNDDGNGAGEESQVWVNPGNDFVVDHTCIEGWSGAFGGTGNFGLDPELVGVGGGDLRLGMNSPCLDSGSDEAVRSEVDLDGSPRISGASVDIGCYEYQDVSGVPNVGDGPNGGSDDSGSGGSGHDSAGSGTASSLDDSSLTLRQSPNGSLVLRIRPPQAGPWLLDAWTAEGRRVGSIADGVAGSTADLATEYVDVALGGWTEVCASGVCFLTLRQSGRTVGSTKLVIVR